MVRPAHLIHLAKRFFGSLSPAPPAAGDDAWAESQLLAGEVELWRRMSGPDRRHAVAVARAAGFGGSAGDRPAVAAALLHDIGKVEAGLGTWGRAVVTAAALVVGRERLAGGDGRAARYLRHDAIGAELLAAAGSDPLTVAWAREHHLAPSAWTVPPEVGRALKAADDD